MSGLNIDALSRVVVWASLSCLDFAPFSDRRRQLIVVAAAGEAVTTSLDLATLRLIFGADSPRGEFRLSRFFLSTRRKGTYLDCLRRRPAQ